MLEIHMTLWQGVLGGSLCLYSTALCHSTICTLLNSVTLQSLLYCNLSLYNLYSTAHFQSTICTLMHAVTILSVLCHYTICTLWLFYLYRLSWGSSVRFKVATLQKPGQFISTVTVGALWGSHYTPSIQAIAAFGSSKKKYFKGKVHSL